MAFDPAFAPFQVEDLYNRSPDAWGGLERSYFSNILGMQNDDPRSFYVKLPRWCRFVRVSVSVIRTEVADGDLLGSTAVTVSRSSAEIAIFGSEGIPSSKTAPTVQILPAFCLPSRPGGPMVFAVVPGEEVGWTFGSLPDNPPENAMAGIAIEFLPGPPNDDEV